MTASVKHRDAEAAAVASRILADPEEQAAFLRDRAGYLAQTSLPADAKEALMGLSEDTLKAETPEVGAFRPVSGLDSCIGDFFFC